MNEEIIITYRVDFIAQEPVETAQLKLAISTTPPRGMLTRDTFNVVVIDNDGEQIHMCMCHVFFLFIFACSVCML